MKKTEWFPASQAPVYEGVYERDTSDCVYFDDKELIYSFWDKEFGWLLSSDDVDEAFSEMYAEDFPVRSCYQNLPWRGVLK